MKLKQQHGHLLILGSPNPTSYSSSGNQTIYVKAEELSSCAQIYSFDLLVTQAPVLNTPQNIELCDVGADNTESFDLTIRNAEILGAQDPALYTITYHTSLTAANANTGAITNFQSYSAGNNTPIYVRVGVTGSPNCFSVTSFTLLLNPVPDVLPVADVFVCQADGYVLPVLATGNYYTQPGGSGTQLNAGDLITTTQTIYVYAQSGTTPNCTDEESFNVTIYPQPVIPALAEIAECDATGAVGQEDFDLTVRTADILAALPGATVSYYPTQAAAQAGTTPVANAAAYPSGTGQAWVRVVDTNGCVSVAPISLVVKPLPAVNPAPTPLAECETAPGESIFLLTEANSDITNGNTTYQVRYYTTQALADAGGTDLAPDHTSMNGSVWARVDDPATGCYTTVQLQLIVVATPVLGAVSPIAECNDDYDNDAIFDLTVAGAQAVNGQPGLVVTYHTSLQAANDGTPAYQ
ncbi:hypothetical protein LRS05_07340 [Flavobacterium sp. J372]|uniref:hypothetical protein n=1 Tax=Flavobacterium sp. J372 TaxID=2898436 RepID=UPI002150B0D5|nr:hypothetical protein [Flavobacterium sp. J372]MCR5861961.1 hypothetical protein [Flavobacterium sp. J372]